VAELDAAVATATSVREEEKAKNTVTIKDSQDAQTAVAQALSVLKEFYAKAAEATSFVQDPEVFDEPYKGMGSENGGVVGMIEVIQSDFARLESETSASESEAQKQYDEFMSDSSVDKAQKTKDIEHKSGKKQNQEQALQEKKTDLDGTQKELDAAVASATNIREEEKAKNTVTIKDSQDAQTAVAQALSVLKEFYAKAAEATSFVQEPEVFDEPYKGMGSENGGVVGMIEVIQSDFARLESETSASETEAQKQYDEFMSDSSVDKAQKTKDIEHKTAKKQDQEQALVSKREDLEGTQKELDAALAYFDKLKPSCVDSGVSYEDRVARRKEEIESLQEALRILNGEDIA
jgi:DNA repair exonuclease SbcCD ATPase subunit